jgi:hypothetical protein
MDRDALVWCLVCKVGLCSDCNEYHTALNVSRSHEMIPYENLRKLPIIAQDIRETSLFSIIVPVFEMSPLSSSSILRIAPKILRHQ